MGQMAKAWSGLVLAGNDGVIAQKSRKSAPPILVFSKVYQELRLDFQEAADLTAEAGLDGIDCPLRPGGEIAPERADEDLPRYAGLLRRNNLQLGLVTTGITSISSPSTEKVLRLAKGLGIGFYRLGFIEHQTGMSPDNLMQEVKAQLKELAALNKQLGLCGLLQNHSPSGKTVYFGGNLEELRRAVEDLNPAQIGVAFDIGHALVVHGSEWERLFDKLMPHFKIAYVKDVSRKAGWVPFGQGDIAATGYFSLLKRMGYDSPISMHIEFDWSDNGKAKNRASLLKTLRDSSQTLRQWLAVA